MVLYQKRKKILHASACLLAGNRLAAASYYVSGYLSGRAFGKKKDIFCSKCAASVYIFHLVIFFVLYYAGLSFLLDWTAFF